MIDSLIDPVIDKLTVTCLAGTGVDITLISTDVEGSTELWEWVSPPCLPQLFSWRAWIVASQWLAAIIVCTGQGMQD